MDKKLKPDRSKRTESEDRMEEHLKNLLNSLNVLSHKYREEGVPVLEDTVKIDESGFTDLYSQEEIEKDSAWSKKIKSGFDINRTGEQLEAIKTILFNKFLGDKYIIVRSSVYDDVKNGVDNVIINRKTGKVICALDEVGVSDRAERAHEKDEKIKSRNLGGGTSLKYGLTTKENKITHKSLEYLPLLKLSLSADEIREALDNDIGAVSAERLPNEVGLLGNFHQSLSNSIPWMEEYLKDELPKAVGMEKLKILSVSEKMDAVQEFLYDIEVKLKEILSPGG